VTRRLRVECPWDREQDARSIVSHTVEESYELADAAASGDDAKMLDELGDVLFQVHFLALLLEERGAGDLAAVADLCREKLIRRHPHVFGEVSPDNAPSAADAERSTLTANDVLRNWDKIKVEVEGGGERPLFSDVPENLPALLYARKVQRRAATRAGGDGLAADPTDAAGQANRHTERLADLATGGADARPGSEQRDEVERAVGDALFALVDAARGLGCDPELALRAAAERFKQRSA
jgi:MazG family protein